jgi:hypothetical protein
VTDTGAASAIDANVSDDEFEIEFDDLPGEGDLIETPSDLSPPAPTAAPAKAAPVAVTATETSAAAPAEAADEAIADFLLDIKLDEEE